VSGTLIRSAALTDVGRSRERNEDAYFEGQRVFAVADGLGGHRAGEVASHLALESIESLDDLDPKRAARDIVDAVRRGNRSVYERQQKDATLKGMGTTMTAVVISEGYAHLAHVGDSRCYLIRGETIRQISNDHTLVARMVSEGKLTPDQAEVHPQRSVLTRALGADKDVDVQETNLVLAPGDRLVLCSDGLSGVLAESEIRRYASDGADLDEICRKLIDTANERGGPDNVTAIVIDVQDTPGEPGPAPAAIKGLGRRARRVPVRPIVWTMLIVGVVVGGWFGVRTWANGSYYVGEDNGKVVIYRGLPVEVGVLSLSSVEETTEIEVEDVTNPSIRRSIEEGIRADSLEDARRIVEVQIEPAVPIRQTSRSTPR